MKNREDIIRYTYILNEIYFKIQSDVNLIICFLDIFLGGLKYKQDCIIFIIFKRLSSVNNILTNFLEKFLF